MSQRHPRPRPGRTPVRPASAPTDPTDLLLDRVRHTGKVGELTPEQAAGGSPMFQGDDGGSPVGWRDRDPTPSPLALSSTAPSSQPPAYSLDGA